MSGVPVLCYVEGNWAYFTTQDLDKQWGDDWNDAPYEHNAGTPYEYHKNDAERGFEPWEIIKVAFESELEPPCEYFSCSNTPFSVQDINRGVVPWLMSSKYSKEPLFKIMAGATLSEFTSIVKNYGGKVFIEM